MENKACISIIFSQFCCDLLSVLGNLKFKSLNCAPRWPIAHSLISIS